MDGGTMAMYSLPTSFSGSQGRGGFRGRQQNAQPAQENLATKDGGKERFANPLLSTQAVATFDGKRMRKAIHRKTVDYNSAVIKYVQNRIWQRDYRDKRAIQPDNLYQLDIEPPCSTLENPINAVTTKFVRTSTNKFRCPIFVLTWTPEGRRLVTGASSGEFTLWNGLAFNFETILQAHDTSVRAMRWSHNDQWMVTADHSGFIKYWQTNMNNVKMYQGHKEPVRGISFCPSDSKFATCSDDGTVRLWDFVRGHEERILRGHGADVKSVDWHPTKALIASGSKDNQQPIKLWDPRSGNSLATIHGHKHTVMQLSWNQNGNWLLTASRDHLLKLFDIRNMKEEIHTFKGHKKEATAVAWHPIHEGLFASGGSDGAVMFWMVGCDREVGSMEEAHEGMVWTLAWHPMGHILASGSNDHTTKFFTRNRPGDRMRDKYNLNNLPAGTEQELLEYDLEPQLMPSLPGMGLEHGLPEHLKPKVEEEEETLPSIPGLDWQSDQQFLFQAAHDAPKKKIPYARPIPRSFEQAWKDNKMPVPGDDMPDKEQQRTPKRQKKKPMQPSPDGNQDRFDDKNDRRRRDRGNGQRHGEPWQQQMEGDFQGPNNEPGFPGQFLGSENQFKGEQHNRSQMQFGQGQMGPGMGLQQMGPRGSQSDFMGGQGEMRGPQGQRPFGFGNQGNQRNQQGMMGEPNVTDMRQQNMRGQQMRDPMMQQGGLNRSQQMEFGQQNMQSPRQQNVRGSQQMDQQNRGFGRQGGSGPFGGQGQGQGHRNGEDQDFRGQAFSDRDERELTGDLDLRQMGGGQNQFGGNRGGGTTMGRNEGPDRGSTSSVSRMGGRDMDRDSTSGPSRGVPGGRGGNRGGFSQQRGQRNDWQDDDDDDLRQGRQFPNDMPSAGQRGQQYSDQDDDGNDFDNFSNRNMRGRGRVDDIRGRGHSEEVRGRGRSDNMRGRGRMDDTRGRGRNDDSMGRGRNDDSMGRGHNDDSMGRGRNDDSRGQRRDFPSSNRGRQFNSPNRGRMGGQGLQSGDQGQFDYSNEDGPSRKRGFDDGPGSWDRGGGPSDEQGMKFGRGSSGWQNQDLDGGSREDFSPNRGSPRGGGGGGRGGRSRGMGGGRGGRSSGHRGGRGGFRGGRGR